jgi:DNA-binding NarL/FixJ family response regulator
MHLFIVDDSEPMRRSLKAMMGDIPGLEIVGEAAGVSEALNGIRATRPDAVILDIHLANGSGLDVLKSIRAQRWRPRVLVFTQYAGPYIRQLLLREGADHFFEKSKDEESLTACLLSLIRGADGGSGHRPDQLS